MDMGMGHYCSQGLGANRDKLDYLLVGMENDIPVTCTWLTKGPPNFTILRSFST